MFNKMNAKKIALLLSIIMVSSFAIAGMIFVLSGNYDEIIGDKYKHNINETALLKTDGLEKIKIDCDSADINIISVDSNEISVHMYGTSGSKNKKNDPKLETKMENGQLVIRVKKALVIGFNISFNNDIKLDVSVPKTYSSDISVNNVSGNIGVEGLNLENLSCDITSGDVTIKSATAKNGMIESVSGDTRIESFNGNLEVSSVSGDISVDYMEFKNNINISSVSGDVTVKLPPNAAFCLDASSVSGDIENTFPITMDGNKRRNSLEGTVGKGENNIILETTSGDIDIIK